MVGPEKVHNAVALNSAVMNSARITGPALAGVRILLVEDEANLRRLEEMKTFARVTAPFDGIVTAPVNKEALAAAGVPHVDLIGADADLPQCARVRLGDRQIGGWFDE